MFHIIILLPFDKLRVLDFLIEDFENIEKSKNSSEAENRWEWDFHPADDQPKAENTYLIGWRKREDSNP